MSGFNLAWGTLKGNLWNSVQIAVPATIISCFLGALNGFVLAKTPFRGASLLFILMMVGMFIPFQAVIIPLFVFLKALALQGTLTGIVIVHIIYGLPFATLIMRNYYETIPDAIVEAAIGRRLRAAPHLLPGDAAAVDPRLRGGRHLPVHQHLERLPLRPHRHLPADLAGHRTAQQPARRHQRRLRDLDGRRLDGRRCLPCSSTSCSVATSSADSPQDR